MHLQEALRAASTLAARPLLDAVTELATAARLSIDLSASAGGRCVERSLPRAGADLTPREREILPLLAAGRTNVEIADGLIISPRTVGVHLSRILRKLGAARRTEAADIARRSGLLDS